MNNRDNFDVEDLFNKYKDNDFDKDEEYNNSNDIEDDDINLLNELDSQFDFLDNDDKDFEKNDSEGIEDIFHNYNYEKDKEDIREEIKDFIFRPKILLPFILTLLVGGFFLVNNLPKIDLLNKEDYQDNYVVKDKEDVIEVNPPLEISEDKKLRIYIEELENKYNR